MTAAPLDSDYYSIKVQLSLCYLNTFTWDDQMTEIIKKQPLIIDQSMIFWVFLSYNFILKAKITKRHFGNPLQESLRN